MLCIKSGPSYLYQDTYPQQQRRTAFTPGPSFPLPEVWSVPQQANDNTQLTRKPHTAGMFPRRRVVQQDAVNATQASISDLDEENVVSTTAKTAVGSLIGADRAGVVCAQKFDEV